MRPILWKNEKGMVLKMKKWELYRGVEDPISGTFNLAEEVSTRSSKILSLSKYAVYFVYFSLIWYFLLFLTFLFQGNLFLALILGSLFITGVITAKLLSILRKFLKEASFRYNAIKVMREGPPAYSIPKGKNKTERFLKYLEMNNKAFDRLMKRRPELLRKDSYAVGRAGKRYHFDAFLHKRRSLFHKLFNSGNPGYSLYIKEYKRSPDMDDLKGLVKDLEDITGNGAAYPNRVVMLIKGGSSYVGIDDKVYDMLAEGKVFLKGNKDKKINLQIAVELPTGHYEFIPFVPELPEILP
jgi:hypothetical protein